MILQRQEMKGGTKTIEFNFYEYDIFIIHGS